MMNEAINVLIEAIKDSYANSGAITEVRKKMIEEFNQKVRVTEGKKYIKIIAGNSVWGFIMKDDEGKFRKGDILKAASWAAPAKNSARGNIIDGGYQIHWTGPNYLR
jgi:hypothetical protein